MPDLVNVTYARTGRSIATNSLGMREMQARAFAAGKAQYLLLKAPPASGKSRALMFLGLDKLFNQGLKKVIVAVPERSIGGSFAKTDLTRHGFFADWAFNPACNLCTPGGVTGKVTAFVNFLNDPAEAILICTHATLRFAFEAVAADKFNDTLLAIDEFHHVSADSDNRLGEVIRAIMANTSAHIIAMTGSYFRGDSVPVLQPEGGRSPRLSRLSAGPPGTAATRVMPSSLISLPSRTRLMMRCGCRSIICSRPLPPHC